jgi:hypothetical protein
MIIRLALVLVCLAVLPASANAEEQTSDREHLRQIVTNLNKLIDDGKLGPRNLTITVKKGNVTVSGRIEDVHESRLILQSIITENKIAGLQLNFGIGCEPFSAENSVVDSELEKRSLNREDGDWQLDFEKEPMRHGTKR